MRHIVKLSILLVITSLFMVLGCSNIKSPIESPIDTHSTTTDYLFDSSEIDNCNRTPLGVYDAVIDPVAQTFIVTPNERGSQGHIALSELYPNCLQITDYGF